MDNFEALLEESVMIHGHLCPGQVLGVRLSMLGLRLIGIDDPKGEDRRNIYVIVEIDRCATDAIQSVTGCSLGKRSLKFVDNGVMAATFINLSDYSAFRIVAIEESRELSKKYCTQILDERKRQLEAYKIMPEEELFKVQRVKVELVPQDMPGKSSGKVQCVVCGEWVQDRRDVYLNDSHLCKTCAGERYYTVLDDISIS